MRWLVTEIDDERYDINITTSTFEGSLDEIEDHYMLNSEDSVEKSENCFVYKESTRKNRNLPDELDKIKDKIEVVHFKYTTVILIETLENRNFYISDSALEKNLKFGIIDLVSHDSN